MPRVDISGIALMVTGFGALQLMLDLGEKEDWFDSGLIVALAIVAVCAIVTFIVRELIAREPQWRFAAYAGRLQDDGAISYIRGRIQILDRDKLEATVCECYRVVKDEFDRLLG